MQNSKMASPLILYPCHMSKHRPQNKGIRVQHPAFIPEVLTSLPTVPFCAFAHSPRDFVDLLEGLFGHKQNIFFLLGDGFPSLQPPIQPCQTWLPYTTLRVWYGIDWTDCIFLKLTESENCIFVQFSLNLFILFFVHRGSIYVFIHSFFLPWQRSQLVFCVSLSTLQASNISAISAQCHF